jgi:hypothetical protein
MSDQDDDRVITAAQRVVDGPADRVLEDRYTDLDAPGVGGGGDGPAIPSPYPRRVDPQLQPAKRDHPLRIALGIVSRQKAYSPLRLAIADLTDDPKHPVYAGYRDEEQTFIASMAKLAILLPAFGLREAVREASAVIGAKTAGDVLKLLAKAWASEFRRFNRRNANNTAPNLPRLFSVTPWKDKLFSVDFTAQGDSDWSKRGFLQRMGLALDISDNEAAASCIRDLGFPYIHGVHRSAGLLNEKGRGLWLSLDFGGRPWDPSFKGSGQAATARSIAELLVLIAQDRFAAPGLWPDIRSIMSAGGDLKQGIYKRLPTAESDTLTAQGKIGYKNAGSFCDGAILRRTSAKGKKLLYVAVALGGADHDDIRRAGSALDDCVLLANGEGVKPTANP